LKLKKVALVVALALLCGLASVTLVQAPDELGKTIADDELSAMKKISELTKDRPDAKDLGSGIVENFSGLLESLHDQRHRNNDHGGNIAREILN